MSDMDKVRFGKTELLVSRIALGALPLQRLDIPEAVELIHGILDLGVNFIDTANGYSDSEEKIGFALKDIPRDSVIITTKTTAQDKKTFMQHVDLSLKRLGSEYIDIYQLHNVCSADDYRLRFGEGGAFEGLTEAIKAGKVRFPAFSSHNLPLAMDIMREGKFYAVQLPLNIIDDAAAKEAVPLAKELDMGFIAMKPLGGGMLTDVCLAFRYLSQFDNVVPDPGIEKLSEMEEIIGVIKSGQSFSATDVAAADKLRKELSSHWCHRCDYCQPCPQKININLALTMESVIRRMPYHQVISFAGDNMVTARSCIQCGVCVERCPYKLKVPDLLKEKLALWDQYIKTK